MNLRDIASGVSTRYLKPLDRVFWLAYGAAFAALIVVSTLLARVIAERRFFFVAIAVFVVFALARTIVVWILRRKPENVVRAASQVWGKEQTEQAIEAVQFVEQFDPKRGVSNALAKLHAERTLSRLPLKLLENAALARHRTIGLRSLVIAVASLGTVIAFWHVCLEGLDVLVARHQRGLFPVAEFSDIEATVTPPAYLHEDPKTYRLLDGQTATDGMLQAPVGSEISLRATPLASSKKWVVEVGAVDVPFVADGQAGLVAHFEVRESVVLKVASEIVGTKIEDPHEFPVRVIADEVPHIQLEGAPRTLNLDEIGQGLELKYDADDDHGLREIALVVQTANKSERRTIAQLDGEPRHDRGGYTLHANDPLLHSNFPMQVTVEARDNDAVTGPKWGKSAVILVKPPTLGAHEVERILAARMLREESTKLVALASEPKADVAKLRDQLTVVAGLADAITAHAPKDIRKAALAIRGHLTELRGKRSSPTESVPPGIPLGGGASEGEWGPPKAGPIGSPKWIEVSEKLARMSDRAYLVIADSMAKSVAISMSEVAMEASKQVREGDPQLLASDLQVLTDGAGNLRRMGVLGEDLGSISQSALRRYHRAEAKGHKPHQALILLDLSQRLSDALPSYVGGGGSGDGVGAPEDKGDGETEEEKSAEDQANELEDLIKEHRSNSDNVDNSLRQATSDSQSQDARDEAKKKAEELRQSVASIPRRRRLSKADETNNARERTEDSANSMERLDVRDAIEKLEKSKESLERAQSNPMVDDDERDKLGQTRRLVQRDLDWLKELDRAATQRASEKAKDQLKGAGEREGEIHKRGEKLRKSAEKTPLPDGVDDLLDRAGSQMEHGERALRKGDGKEGQDRLHDAQKLLDQAREEMEGHSQESGQSQGQRGSEPHEKVKIPPSSGKRDDSFRERVLRGLSKGSQSEQLRDAIKRYTEELLKQ